MDNLKRRKLLDRTSQKVSGDECDFAFTTVSEGYISRKWFLDSCCSRHLSNQKDKMFDYRELKKKEFVGSAAVGSHVKIVGIGNMRLRQVIDGAEILTILKDIGYTLKCRTNLVSLSKALRAGCKILFEPGKTNWRAVRNGIYCYLPDCLFEYKRANQHS